MKNDKYANYSKEELINELEVLKKKKYGLVWDKKNSQEILDTFVNWENVPENFTPKQFPVLKEIKNKEIKTDKERPINLLIQGDNYHSLAVLNFTHQNKINVIYIDPPYNTGSKDFIYNDKIIDKDDPFRHSKWLSFMEKRLRLAQKLLRTTGVIFISIDDNEQAQLKLLCDEIFDERNFIAVLKWKKKKQPSYLHGQVAGVVEYILVYAKNIKNVNNLSLEKRKNINTRVDNSSNSVSERIFKKGVRVKLLSDAKVIKKGVYKNKSMQTEYLSDVFIKDGRTENRVIVRTRFRNNQGQIDKFINEDVLFITKNYGLRRDLLKEELGKRKSITDLLLEWGDNQDSDRELRELFPKGKPFDYPKPVLLIKNLIKSVDCNNGIVLDFMAGSGTTGHAVLNLNKEDGGERRFILCTNNENEICTNVCYPRIEKVVNGYKNSKGENIDGLGGNLKYFQTDFVNAQPTDNNKRNLVKKSSEMICVKEDIFDLIEKNNLNWRVYKRNNNYLGIVFNEEKIDSFVNASNKLNGNFVVYCFSYTELPLIDEFSNMKNKYTVKAIPEVILKVYRKIFNK